MQKIVTYSSKPDIFPADIPKEYHVLVRRLKNKPKLYRTTTTIDSILVNYSYIQHESMSQLIVELEEIHLKLKQKDLIANQKTVPKTVKILLKRYKPEVAYQHIKNLLTHYKIPFEELTNMFNPEQQALIIDINEPKLRWGLRDIRGFANITLSSNKTLLIRNTNSYWSFNKGEQV